jgi:hypothetical protein
MAEPAITSPNFAPVVPPMKWRMDMKKTRLVMVLLLLGAVTVHAQTPFFQGKTIRIVTGYPQAM